VLSNVLSDFFLPEEQNIGEIANTILQGKSKLFLQIMHLPFGINLL